MKLFPLLATLASIGASGCALIPEPTPSTRATPLPAELASRLETARGERTAYPSFRDIPITPTDVRTPAQWAGAVEAVKTQGRGLTEWAVANPPIIDDPAAYAAQARRELGVGPEDISPPDQAARIEALARELRARATPPPPIPN